MANGELDVLLRLELHFRDRADSELKTAQHLRSSQYHDQAHVIEQVARTYQRCADEVAKLATEYHNYETGTDLDD